MISTPFFRLSQEISHSFSVCVSLMSLKLFK
jgi:hypothetical protein